MKIIIPTLYQSMYRGNILPIIGVAKLFFDVIGPITSTLIFLKGSKKKLKLAYWLKISTFQMLEEKSKHTKNAEHNDDFCHIKNEL